MGNRITKIDTNIPNFRRNWKPFHVMNLIHYYVQTNKIYIIYISLPKINCFLYRVTVLIENKQIKKYFSISSKLPVVDTSLNTLNNLTYLPEPNSLSYLL